MSEFASRQVGEVCAVLSFEGWRLAYILEGDDTELYKLVMAGSKQVMVLSASDEVFEIADPVLRCAAKTLADSEWAPGMAYASKEHLRGVITAKRDELMRKWK